ncbi:hypothetical protein AB0L47_37925 [Streptomyces bobili]
MAHGAWRNAPSGQERLTYADGHETLIVTGESWTSGPGAVTTTVRTSMPA